MLSFRRVLLETPHAGVNDVDRQAQRDYACAAMRDCLMSRGEAPFPAYMLYGQDGVVDGANPAERNLAIEAGLSWRNEAAAVVVYVDLGVSNGMLRGIRAALADGITVEARSLRGADAQRVLKTALSDAFIATAPTAGAFRRMMLESPYAAPTPEGVAENEAYARRALRDCLFNGCAPMASHLLYTQLGCLDDRNPEERRVGIDAGLAWRVVTEGSLVFIDRGVSTGMMYGVRAALKSGKTVEPRSLDGKDAKAVLDEAIAKAETAAKAA